jgi:hypothetical protein
MANETVSVSGPISVKSDAKQRVAFDLMYHIGSQCYDSDKAAQKSKEYWLKLYRQCWKAANGNALESILKEE